MKTAVELFEESLAYDFDTLDDQRRRVQVTHSPDNPIKIRKDIAGCPDKYTSDSVRYNFKRAYNCEHERIKEKLEYKENNACMCFFNRIDILIGKLEDGQSKSNDLVDKVNSNRPIKRSRSVLNDPYDHTKFIEYVEEVEAHISNLEYISREGKEHLVENYNGVLVILEELMSCVNRIAIMSLRGKILYVGQKDIVEGFNENVEVFVDIHRHIHPIVEALFYCNQCTNKLRRIRT